MSKSKPKPSCFIIMPISTPEGMVEAYRGDPDHFTHVLEHLFTPSLESAGFTVIPPKSKGSNIIQAEIIKQLSEADLVLCDMSTLNPNVFFEFGIRTALDKPVALVVDHKTGNLPFDTSIINFHEYDGALELWKNKDEMKALAEHSSVAYKNSDNQNSLWKYFGVSSQVGQFNPDATTIENKIDLLSQEVLALKKIQKSPVSAALLGSQGLLGSAIDMSSGNAFPSKKGLLGLGDMSPEYRETIKAYIDSRTKPPSLAPAKGKK